MVREKLKTKVGVRKIFTGTFEQYGFVRDDNGGIISTALLLNVKAKGEVVAEHVWIRLPSGLDLVMSKGDTIMFRATVSEYRKRYGRNREDIGLECPTKIRKCEA